MTPPAIILGFRRPRHQKQLQGGSPTSETDCGPRSVIVAAEAASHGGIVVDQSEGPRWVRLLRREMDEPRGGTTLIQHETALQSTLMDGAMLAVGRPDVRVILGTMAHRACAELLQEGRALIVLIDYGRLNDLMPRLSGSPTYRGLHFVTLVGHGEDAHGTDWTYLYDPLHDGRRPGIPRGVQSVRIERYLRAAETAGTPKAGPGRAKVAIVRSM